MNGFELNKIAAAILLAGIIAMVVGIVTEGLYHPEREIEKRGYTIAGAEEAVAPSTAAAAPAVPVDIASFMAAADVAAGEVLSKKCTICHDFTKGGANKIGPALWGVVGRDVGKHEGFAYSTAMAAHGGHWGYQEISEFLTAPAKYVKGTKMAFAGLSKPQDRANLLAYLRSLSDSPLPLPEVKAVPVEAASEAQAEAPKMSEKQEEAVEKAAKKVVEADKIVAEKK
jgi:cytochrome c